MSEYKEFVPRPTARKKEVTLFASVEMSEYEVAEMVSSRIEGREYVLRELVHRLAREICKHPKVMTIIEHKDVRRLTNIAQARVTLLVDE